MQTGTTTTSATPPIACTLAPGDFKERLAWITDLTRDALLSHRRRDLELDLRFRPETTERVRALVRRERACCAFLTFDLREAPGEVQLTIRAPEDARLAADALFEQFSPQGDNA